ncbi:MAG: hypothetical protein HY263_05945 [Chloroflexi bacterium]|nr:hypothetical protein [Chloroflexota bacterium]
MRRFRALAMVAIALLAACSPTVPTPVPTGHLASPEPSAQSLVSDPVRACRDPGSFETPLPSGVTEPVDIFNSSYSPSPGSDGGHVTVGVLRAPEIFDPLRAVDPRDTVLTEATWSGLTMWTADYKAAPDLAVRVPTLMNRMVELSGDGALGGPMSVLWCLRSGTTWSDGTPLTCSDFQYTADWLRDVAPELQPVYGPISAVDCVDPDVMVIRYESPFEAYITHALIPLPRHALEARSVADLQSGSPFSLTELVTLPTSGAFHVSRVAGSTFELVRNEGYRAGHRAARAHLDGLTIRVLPTAAALVGSFRAGDIDLATDLGWADIPSLESAGLRDEIAAAPGFAYDTLRFNLASPVAGDAAIRRALAFVIDTTALADALGPDGEEQVAQGVVAPQAWFYEEIARDPLSRDNALAALDQGGWRMTGGRLVRSVDGQPAVLRLCTTDDARHRAAAGIVRTAGSSIGIAMELRFVPSSTLTAASRPSAAPTECSVPQGNYDAAVMALTSFYDPLDFRLRYHSGFIEPVGENDGRVSIRAIDDAIDAVASTVDLAAIKVAMDHLQEAIASAVVEIPIGSRKDVALVRIPSAGQPGLGNFFSDPGGPVTWNAEDWYLVPAVATPPPAASRFP